MLIQQQSQRTHNLPTNNDESKRIYPKNDVATIDEITQLMIKTALTTNKQPTSLLLLQNCISIPVILSLSISIILWQSSYGGHGQDPILAPFSGEEREQMRDKIESMFYHGYNNYLNNASPDYDELKPIVCAGMNTWGGYQLTLIDTLDTLIVMGNYTEFNRVANLLIENLSFDIDTNVSVFETNIRVVGGLLAAHLLAHKSRFTTMLNSPSDTVNIAEHQDDDDHNQQVKNQNAWPCAGPLLRMAEDVARRLLPAFETATGMPYGTVNLRHGVPDGETPVTCTAGIGTFLLEFGTLSRLTGDPIFEQKARKALESLHAARSNIDLPGNHINVQDSTWTAMDAGIGASVDSYFEYLIKGAAMFGDTQLASWFGTYLKSLIKHTLKADWWLWVRMDTGQVTLPVFQSLESFWPGLLTMIGDIKQAQQSIYNYEIILKKYGFLPEIYDIAIQKPIEGREAYPLRPEFAESLFYLYRATKDPQLLRIGAGLVETIEHSSRTDCGYATISNIINHTIEDRMESFYLAETLKYLYLLFSEDTNHFVWNDGSHGKVFKNPYTGKDCIADAGGYVFTTEAHLIDPGLFTCCSKPEQDDNPEPEINDKNNSENNYSYLSNDTIVALTSKSGESIIDKMDNNVTESNLRKNSMSTEKDLSERSTQLIELNNILRCPVQKKDLRFSLYGQYFPVK